jgi:Domain of unknown function (DUF4278)
MLDEYKQSYPNSNTLNLHQLILPGEKTMLLTYRNVSYEFPAQQTGLTNFNTFARYRGILYHLSQPTTSQKPKPSVQLKYRGIVYDAHTLQFDTGVQISAEC